MADQVMRHETTTLPVGEGWSWICSCDDHGSIPFDTIEGAEAAQQRHIIREADRG